MVAGVPVVSCAEISAIDLDNISLADVRAAFRWAQPLVMRQGWRDDAEPGFKPGVVRTGWHGDHLYVFADLTDSDVTTSATAHGQRFWELGDTFEMFMRRDGVASYIECHVMPTNLRLQLRFPEGGPAALKASDPVDAARIPGDGFKSRVWQRENGDGWAVLAAIPASLADAPAGSLAGATWRVSFSRYDFTRGVSAPVLSSTSPHAAIAFHRQHEWGVLRCVERNR
jgi:hypothetical protein